MNYETERKRVLEEVRKRLNELFPVEKLPEPDPICYKCKQPMCQVFPERGGNSYFWCAERGCGHREFSI